MAVSTRSLLIAAALLAATSAFAPAAWAGCGVNATMLKKHASWSSDGQDQAMLIPVNLGQGTIVGMWSVTLTTPGGPFDWGYQVWHDDGTEIMNSGIHSPASENFCMGVWAQTGPFSYKLNHFALGYDPVSGTLAAKINLKENVTVDARGNSFAGSFAADIYPVAGPAQHVSGQVVGQRITAN